MLIYDVRSTEYISAAFRTRQAKISYGLGTQIFAQNSSCLPMSLVVVAGLWGRGQIGPWLDLHFHRTIGPLHLTSIPTAEVIHVDCR